MAQATAWAAQTAQPPETETEGMAEEFERRMTAICDAAMPRVKTQGRNNTYWWTPDLESKRRDCARARRGFQHWKRKKTRDSAEGEQRHLRYTAAVAALQRAIKEAKTKAWADLQSTIDRDPWGRPYRIVLAKLRPRAPPVTAIMETEQLEQVLNNLFPRSQEPRTTIRYSLEEEENPAQITPAEMNAAIKKMATKNTAPGPDGIPGKALALALTVLGEGLREILDRCLREGIIPGCWKRSKLVLIPQPGKEGDTTNAYRPICLLSEAGKLLERIVMGRILEHLESAGPNIHQHQYGFRSRRSTVDAISRVKGITEGAVRRGGIALAVSVDIANAFNTLPWRAIEEGLERHNLPKYIRNTIGSYLTGRTTEYVGMGGKEQRTVDRGVPQGSVLGPLLWNIGYDAVLNTTLPTGVYVTCYADDTLLIACGRKWGRTTRLMEVGLEALIRRIRNLGLEVATQKMEAMWFHRLPRNRKPPETWIAVGRDRIPTGPSLKYLGLILDGRLNFQEHFRQLTPRVEKVALSLGRLLPNIGGPKESVRRLYTSVAQAMMLYGAPIWATEEALSRQNIQLLRRVQRRMALRVIRAYRTVSTEAAITLAGMTPFDHLARAFSEAYWESHDKSTPVQVQQGNQESPKERAERRARARWKQELRSGASEKRAIGAILPKWEEWAEKGPGRLTYRITQILTGHGCFGEYLRRIGAEKTAACHHCDAEMDTAQHTLAECGAFEEPRGRLAAVIGRSLTPAAIVDAMLASDTRKEAVSTFCEEVMSLKEAAERDRENSNPDRARRRKERRQNKRQQNPQG